MIFCADSSQSTLVIDSHSSSASLRVASRSASSSSPQKRPWPFAWQRNAMALHAAARVVAFLSSRVAFIQAHALVTVASGTSNVAGVVVVVVAAAAAEEEATAGPWSPLVSSSAGSGVTSVSQCSAVLPFCKKASKAGLQHFGPVLAKSGSSATLRSTSVGSTKTVASRTARAARALHDAASTSTSWSFLLSWMSFSVAYATTVNMDRELCGVSSP
mmetsp:Transcript_75989/g.216895  ORF Transcript_75989/g.216895 Transcript_75989/m.216895 type:complete len:216 (+) Transcript_75989:823-1470(+)